MESLFQDRELTKNVWAVIPVKGFACGKSRLALPDRARRAVIRLFLDHVLHVTKKVLSTRVIVTSGDVAVLETAVARGAVPWREPVQGGLNASLTSAAAHARARGGGGVLSVFADLPLLVAGDLEAMIASFDGCNAVVAPDTRLRGTNAMLMAANAMTYRHGKNSFARHLAGAREAGLRIEVVKRPGLSGDVDLPADLMALDWPRFTDDCVPDWLPTDGHRGGQIKTAAS